MLPKLLEVIKIAATDAVNAANPVAVVYGTVASVSPLSVKLEQKSLLTASFLTSLCPYLESGDRVALLRVQGGQEYLILGKVV